jgi:hypothetical protein
MHDRRRYRLCLLGEPRSCNGQPLFRGSRRSGHIPIAPRSAHMVVFCRDWSSLLELGDYSFLWSLFGDRNRIGRFIDWTHQRGGFDSTRALRWMALLLALPIGVATLLAIPIHSSLCDDNIVVGHYAQLAPQCLTYSRARRVALVDGLRDRSGKFAARAEIIVDFDDGSRWRSADNRDFTPEVDSGLAEFLQRKTGASLGTRRD